MGEPSNGHSPVTSRSHPESARARSAPLPRKRPRPARSPNGRRPCRRTPSLLRTEASPRAAPRFRRGRPFNRTCARLIALPSRIRASANAAASAEAAAPCAKSGRLPNAFTASDSRFLTCSATFSAWANRQTDILPSRRAPISNPRERERRRVRGSRRALREIRTTTKRLHRFR